MSSKLIDFIRYWTTLNNI